MRHTLLVATSNRGKLEELRNLLSGLPFDVKCPTDVFKEPKSPVEDGKTFEENATIKAVALAKASMLLTLADDSGLEVDLLDGSPGVRSARYAHDRATDAENNAALLAALEKVGDPITGNHEPPRARFRCVLALVDPLTTFTPTLFSGTCEGQITATPRGAHGFGYDPVFVVDGQDGRTMAELTEDEKNRVSHRAKAFEGLRAKLAAVVSDRERKMCDLYK